MGKTATNVKRAVKTAQTTTRVTGGVMGFVWRHRVGLGPFLVGIFVLALAVLLGWLVPNPLWGYGSILLATALLLVAARFGVNDREGKVHARRERYHLYAVTVASAAFVWMWYGAVLTGVISWKTGLNIWWWGLVALGIPWWWNLRRRSRVSLENDLDAWPIVTDGTTLARTWWSGYKKTSTGWTGLLHLPPQLSRRTVLTQTELIEGLTRSPSDSITIEPAGRNASLVRVTCVETDPHADAIPWDGRSARSIGDLVTLGKYDDGSLERTSWYKPSSGGYHRLMGGVTRSGKSGLMHLLCALYGPAEDVVLWGIDLKGGTALLPWAPLFDWIATTPEEAMVMMQAAEQLVNARAATLGRRGKEVAPISRDFPAVLLFCDEIASLVGDSAPRHISRYAGPSMVEVGRKGAGMGVFMTLATQYPTLGALRDSQLKSQLTWRACFRLAEPQQGHYVLPNMHKGVDPYNISADRQGTCYIDSAGKFRYATLRVVYFDHETRRRPIVEQHWQTTPEIDKMSLKWQDEKLMAAYKSRTIWTPEMLDRVAADEEIEGARLSDLYDDSDDINADGVVDERDRAIEDGRDEGNEDHMVDIENDDEPITETIARRDATDPVTAESERRARVVWLEAHKLKPENVAREQYRVALRKVGSEGIGPRALAEMCGTHERTMHRWLEKDVTDGKVVRLSYGRYVLASVHSSYRS